MVGRGSVVILPLTFEPLTSGPHTERQELLEDMRSRTSLVIIQHLRMLRFQSSLTKQERQRELLFL